MAHKKRGKRAHSRLEKWNGMTRRARREGTKSKRR